MLWFFSVGLADVSLLHAAVHKIPGRKCVCVLLTVIVKCSPTIICVSVGPCAHAKQYFQKVFCIQRSVEQQIEINHFCVCVLCRLIYFILFSSFACSRSSVSISPLPAFCSAVCVLFIFSLFLRFRQR